MSTLFLAVLLPLLFTLFRFLYNKLYLPYLTSIFFSRQGISGPTRHLILGNVRDYQAMLCKAQSKPLPCINQGNLVDRVTPFFSQWIQQFGSPFVYWFGTRPRLVLTDPDLVRTVFLNATSVFGEREEVDAPAKLLIGDGLPMLNIDGSLWAHHRRVIVPAFNMERVKAWIPEIAATVSSMLDRWEAYGGTRMEFEIDVFREFEIFTSAVLAIVAFGSSYEEGKRVFELLEEQLRLVVMSQQSLDLFKFLPIKKNQMRWRLEKEVNDSLLKLLKKNERKCEDAKNFIGLMLAANKAEGPKMGIQEMIDECKTMNTAGRITSTSFLSWAVLLLAAHKEWQHKAREEVMAAFRKDQYPTADDMANLKILNMILKETLRLYPPATFLNRIATKNTKLGKFDIPKGTLLQLAVICIHHDTSIWGHDAHEFKPQRFAEGTIHRAYFPFGAGPAFCLGQNLANIEAKIALAMLLQRFEFDVSATYLHAPMLYVALQPQYGAQILLRKI